MIFALRKISIFLMKKQHHISYHEEVHTQLDPSYHLFCLQPPQLRLLGNWMMFSCIIGDNSICGSSSIAMWSFISNLSKKS